MRRLRAFTLIELLVVITIIVVLASIVFPVALSMAARAKVTACAANLRQLAQGLTIYYGDVGQGRFYPKQDGAKFVAALYRSGVVNESKVFICPSTDDDNQDGELLKGKDGDDVPAGVLSYAGRRNSASSPCNILAAERRKIPASRIAVFCDRVWEDKDGPMTNHGDRVVVAYLDSHTDTLLVKQHLDGKLQLGEGGHEKLADLQSE